MRPAIAILLLALSRADPPADELSAGAPQSPQASAAVEADRVELRPSGLLDVRLRNVDVFLALELLSEQTGRNIVVNNGVAGTVSVVLRKVRFDEALAAILDTNNLVAAERSGVLYVSAKPAPATTAQAAATEMRVFRLSYISAAEAESFVKPLLTADGKTARTKEPESGVATQSDKAGGYNPAMGEVLIVVDTPDNLARIAEAVAEIDGQPQQVLVEATILRATLNESTALGIDFNTLAGVDFQTLQAQSPGVATIGLGTVPQAQLNNTSVAARTELNAAVPSGGFTFGVVKDQIAAFIRALEQLTDVTILANPKVLTLNKQRGQIIVGRRDGYLTTTVTETAAVQTVEFLETGTKLIFRPYVSRDGYVRMEIHPEDSNGGLTAANLPFQETTEATTNVIVKDGHTIVIGGLFRERTTTGKSQVPGLGSIPGFGLLFGVQQNATVREEVIILLTVHVLTGGASEDQATERMLENTERVRVGARRGLMGIGREQLAEARYLAAVEAVDRGKLDEALTQVRLCLFLNARHADALRLEERLQGERAWRSDTSLIRSFVRDRIREQAGLPPTPPFERPDVKPLLPARPAGESAPAPRAGPAPATEPRGAVGGGMSDGDD
ncbi:MAG: type II secretion system protein GspD [Phycisphaerae bacterium]